MLSLVINNTSAQTEDDLYLKAFGKKKGTNIQLLTVPLIINKRDHSDVQIVFNGREEETRIKLDKLIQQIEKILKVEVLEAINKDFSGKDEINLAELTTHNISARYDSRQLELHIEMPAELRKTEVISFRPSNSFLSKNDLIKPGNFSAYVNIYSDLQYVWKGDMAGRQPANVVFDGALNYSDWVLEAEAFYREAKPKPFQRGNFRLVKDLPDYNIRIAAMDVALPAIDFQNAMAARGLIIAKNFQLRPDLITYPSSQKQFLLEHPSTVEILVNSNPYRTLHLPAGSYDLRDFPVARGVNDIIIRINDDFGRQRELAFPFISETRLLAEDLHEYGYGFGFPSVIAEGKYDTRHLFFSGFHRIGLYENMTAGLNAQGDINQQLLGGELSFASRLGNFSLRGAMSHGEEDGYGFAGSLNYSYQAPINSSHRQRLWDLSAISLTQDFTPPGQIHESSSLALDVTGEVSQPLGNDIFFSVRGNYQRSFNSNGNSNNVSVLFRKNISRQLSWDVGLTRTDHFSNGVDYQVSTNIRFSFGDNRQSLRSSYDSKDQSKRLSWDRRSNKNYGGIDIGVDAIKKGNLTALTGNLQHRGNRFEATMRHNLEWSRANSQSKTNRTSLSIASTLAYADGHFGISRPIRDSFAIVVPHSSIRDQYIGVNPSKDSYQAKSGILGAAVVPDLISYHTRTLTIDVPELPLGYNLDNDLPNLLPTFRSGTIIPLGGDSNVLLAGILNIREGEPANLETGKLIAIDDPNQEAHPFFTNRKGKFYIDSLKPGNYQLQLFSFPKAKLTIEIPKDTAGVYNIGNIDIY